MPLGQCLEPGSQLAPIGVLSPCFLEQMALSKMEQTFDIDAKNDVISRCLRDMSDHAEVQ